MLFLYHMMFVSFNSSKTGATNGSETAYPFGVREFTFFVGFVLLKLLPYIWYFVDPIFLLAIGLSCLSFDLWFLVTSLECSSCSYL